jgi:hypothetical protein
MLLTWRTAVELFAMIERGPGPMMIRHGWLLLLLLMGCSSTVVLDRDVPSGFDLDGEWVVDAAASEVAPGTRRLRAQGIGISLVAHDFPVLRCERMTIEQSADSMGIEYDGASYRDVSWGVRQRGLWEVNAGWEEGVFRILSKARDAKAEEMMTLADSGRRLIVQVVVESEGDTIDITRQFVRR